METNTINPETIFNKERFEAWLFSQPDERSVDFTSNTNCFMCKFIKETTQFKSPAVGDYYVRPFGYNENDDEKRNLKIPFFEYLIDLFGPRTLTFADVKANYLKRNPQFAKDFLNSTNTDSLDSRTRDEIHCKTKQLESAK